MKKMMTSTKKMKTSFSAGRLLIAALALMVVLAGAAGAQDAPVATLEAGDFRALAVMQNGERLLVADAAASQVRIFNISTPASPALITAVDTGGTPVALAGAAAYAIAAVQTGGSSDVLEVIAPSMFNRRFPYLTLNYIDVARGVREVILSPDGQHGAAVGESAYTLLEIIAPEEISAVPVQTDRPIAAAAMTSDRLFLAFEDEASLETVLLRDGTSEAIIALDAPALALTVSSDGTRIAALTTGGEVAIYDTATLSHLLEGDADDAAAARFLDSASADLVMLTANRRAIRLYDTAGGALSLRNTLTLESAARRFTTFDGFIFVTDGSSVNIFGVR